MKIKKINQRVELNIHKTLTSVITLITIFIFNIGTYQAQTPPSGASGGNVTPCPCVCSVTAGDPGEPVWTPCGAECAEIVILPPTTRKDHFTEESSNCVSGLRMFEQEITITGKERSTKGKMTVTTQNQRTAPINDPGASCSGCPTCPPLVETYDCGKSNKICPPNDGDQKETPGEIVDKGCVPMPV